LKVNELSPPLVGMNILLNSTRQFQEQVRSANTPDPFGIYTVDLDAAFGELPDDINFGTTLRTIDTAKSLYLVTERLPSFGVRVDPLADLAIHVLSIKSVSFLIESYRTGAAVLFYKPPTDIGNVRILNVESMTELETETKSHPWFGTNGPLERSVEPLIPLSDVNGA